MKPITITITLSTIEKVKKFVNIVGKYDGEFDLVSDRYIVDAKSIMGIFSLDLGKPLVLNILDEVNGEKALAELKEFEA